MRVGERAGGWAARGVGHSPEIRGRPEGAPYPRAASQVRRVYHLRRIGFYLHKEFRGGRIGFYLPKEFRGDLLKKSYKKKACIFKKFSRCAGNLFIVILSTQRIPGGDLVENRCFIEVKLVNVCRFSIMKRQLSEKNFPLRGQFIHCNFIYIKNSGGRLCIKLLFY